MGYSTKFSTGRHCREVQPLILGGDGALNKVLYREALPRGPTPDPLKYSKIPKISPTGLHFSKALFEGLIFGGAYIQKGLHDNGGKFVL